MQTVLLIRSDEAGMVYLNGRLAGETDGEHPLALPVSPFGALFVELRPYSPGFLPLAVRLPLSHGAPVIEEPDPRMCIALWPDGVVELELAPQALPSPHMPEPIGRTGEISFLYTDAPALLCSTPSGSFTHPLPEGALKPSASSVPSGVLFLGGLKDGGQYAAALGHDASALLLSVTGKSIIPLEDGSGLRLLHAYGDSVGHASLETWTASPQGWRMTLAEPMWEHGAPIRPDTPAAAAEAAVEAAQLGLMSEAMSYFAPAVSCTEALGRAAGFDGCVPLRAPLPDGRPAIGLMKMKNHVLTIVPAYYTASSGGAASPWQLTGLEIHEDA